MFIPWIIAAQLPTLGALVSTYSFLFFGARVIFISPSILVGAPLGGENAARAHQIISGYWKHRPLSLRCNHTMSSSNLHAEINAPATAQGPQVISSVFGDNANIRE